MVPVPTTAGMPSSRAMIAPLQVRPSLLVTMAEARFMIVEAGPVSMVNITRVAPGSERTIRCTPPTRDRLILECMIHSVGDGAVVIERGEHLTDRHEHRIDADNVEERLLLPDEGRIRGIPRRSRRTWLRTKPRFSPASRS